MFFTLLALALVSPAVAQADKFGQPQDRAASGKGDQAAGARILAEFRQASIQGDHWLGFELRVMPHKGAERIVSGTLLGTRGEKGPLWRLGIGGQQWLIQSGPQPAAWTTGNAGEIVPAAPGQSLGGTGLTVFEIQMPFLYWTDFTYEGQGKARGRPTHSFILRPPAGYVPPEPGLTGVRVLIDTQFQALVQAELLGEKGAAVKTIALLDLKEVNKQWLLKTADIRDLRSRDKTRLAFTGAALDLDLPATVFTPDDLRNAPPAVPPEKIVRF